jgi:hypothetical protein
VAKSRGSTANRTLWRTSGGSANKAAISQASVDDAQVIVMDKDEEWGMGGYTVVIAASAAGIKL